MRFEYTNDSVKMIYSWIHNNHDPCEVEDLAHSRLPLELRNSIVDSVDRHTNKQSIKASLRLSLEELDNDSQVPDKSLRNAVRCDFEALMVAASPDQFETQ
ncbi:hypothetical protein [Absidia glauca]|uniref:Uncharacterized protein n=1 Tax=Absidia glauca TaxID=4829 RepID=A0A168PTZ9_ABSGL|nr:hypothetical protein [Absidia glauca]